MHAIAGHLTDRVHLSDDVVQSLVVVSGLLIGARTIVGVRLIAALARRLFDPELERWATMLQRLALGALVLLGVLALGVRFSGFNANRVIIVALIGVMILAVLTSATFVELDQLMSARAVAVRRRATRSDSWPDEPPPPA